MPHRREKLQEQNCSFEKKNSVCSYAEISIDTERPCPVLHTTRLLFFKKGMGKLKINEREYEIKPNTVVSIMPWDTLSITEVNKPLKLIRIVYNKNSLDYLISLNKPYEKEFNTFSVLEKIPVKNLNYKDSKCLTKIIKDIKKEKNNESSSEEQLEQSITDCIIIVKLIDFINHYVKMAYKSENEGNNGNSNNDVKTKVIKHIYCHTSESLTREKIANTYDISKAKVSEYVKDFSGLSVNKMINRIRISNVIDLLLNTDMCLEEIADKTGYCDVSHLIKNFKAITDVSPGDFREKHSNIPLNRHRKVIKLGFKIIEYINKHFTEDLSIIDLSRIFNVSPAFIDKCLLIIVEKNFNDYSDYRRIIKACELLLVQEKPVVDTAISVGYNCVRTFRRKFKQIMNTTPGRYRKECFLGDDYLSEFELSA